MWQHGGFFHAIGLVEATKLSFMQAEIMGPPAEDLDPEDDDWKNYV
jgi:hypothetical protein